MRVFRRRGLALALFSLALTAPAASGALAQTAPVAAATPTIRILAIGRPTAAATPEALRRVLPAEVRATVKLYLDGKIDQWYSLRDQSGVAFILNVTDPAEARAMLEALPLGQAGLMRFDLTPLGPLNPLRALLAPAG